MTPTADACVKRELAVPIVTLNGTSREALLAMHRTALRSLCTARRDLAETAPHGRDFQTAAPGTFELACAQHRGRVAALSGGGGAPAGQGARP